MTIRTMGRITAAALAVAALFAACAEGAVDAGSSSEVTELRDQALATAELVEGLQDRVGDLESSLAAMADDGNEAAAELTALRKKLKASLASLRTSLRAAKDDAGGAASSASAALSRAESLARELTVLEDRFNFHLKKEHGGGG